MILKILYILIKGWFQERQLIFLPLEIAKNQSETQKNGSIQNMKLLAHAPGKI